MNNKLNSWKDIKNDDNIEFIEDVILSIDLSKNCFEDNYKNILNKLNGKYNITKTINYYFMKDTKKKNVLVFINKEKKNEFYKLGL
jgi:hypothetical protein